MPFTSTRYNFPIANLTISCCGDQGDLGDLGDMEEKNSNRVGPADHPECTDPQGDLTHWAIWMT